jgi:hypothetical protein
MSVTFLVDISDDEYFRHEPVRNAKHLFGIYNTALLEFAYRDVLVLQRSFVFVM